MPHTEGKDNHWYKDGSSSLNLGSEYSDDEREFMLALDRFKRRKHKPFPTCADVLGVLLALGYHK